MYKTLLIIIAAFIAVLVVAAALQMERMQLEIEALQNHITIDRSGGTPVGRFILYPASEEVKSLGWKNAEPEMRTEEPIVVRPVLYRIDTTNGKTDRLEQVAGFNEVNLHGYRFQGWTPLQEGNPMEALEKIVGPMRIRN
jgi:hypothetical protein